MSEIKSDILSLFYINFKDVSEIKKAIKEEIFKKQFIPTKY